MTTPTQLFTLLDACFDAQNEATALWHSQEPEADDVAPDAPASPETLLALVRAQHLRNFRLWHIEDTARRRDVTPDVIADCKYRIDRLNQERNDRIERVDACLGALLSPLLPASPAPHINTESLGMAIDRLSILSLKIWHMDEQVRRTDVTPEHIASCEKKLAVPRGLLTVMPSGPTSALPSSISSPSSSRGPRPPSCISSSRCTTTPR